MNLKGVSNRPESWIKTYLTNFCDLIMGQSPPSSTYNIEGKGLPFYQGKSEFGTLYPVPQKFCSEPKKIAYEGDILLSVRAPVGPTNISPHKACIGRGLAAIRPLDGIQSKFILYLFRNVEPLISTQGTGSTFKAISKDFIEHLEFPLPPLLEQNQIIEKIEELSSELDNGIESLKKAREQLKTYRQAVLKYAFEGKLTKEWRTQQIQAGNPPEPAENLLERIRKEREKHYQQEIEDWEKAYEQAEKEGKNKPARPKKPKELSPLTKQELAELPELPDGWGWVKVGEISNNIQYGYTASATNKKVGPKLLRITDIQKNRVDWESVPYCEIKNEEIRKYLLEDGDLVFARTGATVGKSFLIKKVKDESIYASYLIRLRFPTYVSNDFIYSYFQSIHYWVQITEGQVGIGQPNVNGSKLSELIMPLCSEIEQNAIVQEIESRLSVCDKIEQTIEDSLKKAEVLRQSILKKAFSGELTKDWREKHPELISGENSAEKLLERIKSEKAFVTGRKKLRSKKMKKNEQSRDKKSDP